MLSFARWVILLQVIAYSLFASSQSAVSNCDSVLKLPSLPRLVTAKARFQEHPQNLQERNILKLGRKAVPLLIECVGDESETVQPAYDFWPETKVQVLAFSYLVDLFSDPDGKITVDDVVSWKSVTSEFPGESDWEAWSDYLKKYGAKQIQHSWTESWGRNQKILSWDSRAKCFKKVAPTGRSRRLQK